MKKVAKTVQNFQESIFSKITALSYQKNAINLSQGLPDFDGPQWIKDFAKDAIDQGFNQTTHAIGAEQLREAVRRNSKKFYDLDYDSQKEITITTGATEAIFSTILALVDPGDEVIIFEPFFDTYIPAIQLVQATPVVVTLKAPDFSFDQEELCKAFSSKTKLVIFNTPHNPTGKVFTQAEMEILCNLVKEHDCYLISDEVYEFLTFDNFDHIPPATLPGMKERTITCSSTGKTFGFTGWRIGWAQANEEITHAVRMVHQNNVFSVAFPLQVGMSKALSRMDEYLPHLRTLYSDKRNLLYEGLVEAGFNPIKPQGTYFIYSPIDPMSDKRDVDFCMELIKTKKVATIPPSAFYCKSKEGESYIRFCFAKKDETLKEAIRRLKCK